MKRFRDSGSEEEGVAVYRFSIKSPSFDHVDSFTKIMIGQPRFILAYQAPADTEFELWDHVGGRELKQRLLEAKNRISGLVAAGNEDIYRWARNDTFPADHGGSEMFGNRAGDKLVEIGKVFDLFEGLENPFWFLDICGGPGSFSEVILNSYPTCLGFGITLDTRPSHPGLWWYPHLLSHHRFTVISGKSGGDVTSLDNIAGVERKVWGRVGLSVADGLDAAYAISPKQDHRMQELATARLLFAEIVLALGATRIKGHFVCKFFDCFTMVTVGMLYILCQCFDEVSVVKPSRSRAVNSERYVVARFRRWIPAGFMVYLRSFLAQWRPDHVPVYVVDPLLLGQDRIFLRSLEQAVTGLAERQIMAINKTMDAADLRLAVSGDSPGEKRRRRQWTSLLG